MTKKGRVIASLGPAKLWDLYGVCPSVFSFLPTNLLRGSQQRARSALRYGNKAAGRPPSAPPPGGANCFPSLSRSPFFPPPPPSSGPRRRFFYQRPSGTTRVGAFIAVVVVVADEESLGELEREPELSRDGDRLGELAEQGRFR